MARRIGLFGGSFNPPHVAHLAVAEAAREQARLDRVIWMPAAASPFKADEAVPASPHRLAMARLATAGNPAFEVSDLEARRGGVSYTVDTVCALAEAYPAASLFLIIGGDSLAGFPRWRQPGEILEHARLVVYRRPGDRLDEADLPAWVLDRATFVDAPRIDLSSSDVRAMLAAGRSARYLVPDAVRAYARENGLY
jgi:nicotinate-nucleotide adenylyltransferase